jgi:hypothetical protein
MQKSRVLWDGWQHGPVATRSGKIHPPRAVALGPRCFAKNYKHHPKMEVAMKLIPTRGFPLVPLLMSLFVSLCIASPDFSAAYTCAAGFCDGSSDHPYEIANKTDLKQLQDTKGDWIFHFKQTANITFEAADFASGGTFYNSGGGWSPIGYRNGTDYTYSFKGSYDGQGYKISGLTISRPSEDDVGLFGHVGTGNSDVTNIVIKNVGLVGAVVAGARGVGALIGRVTGNKYTLIEKCYSLKSSGDTGSVTGDGATGGLIGSHNSWQSTPGGVDNPVVQYSWSDLPVIFSRNTNQVGDQDKFGGLAGCSQKGTISNCYAKGRVTVNATDLAAGQRVGGIAGCIIERGKTINSYSTGVVDASNCTWVGGFIGNVSSAGSGNAGTSTACFWNISVNPSLNGVGDVNPFSGVTGKTTTELQNETTFPTASGWDFDTIWAMDTLNEGYPYLKISPLLVELASFTATPSQNGILLEWETASEIDHAGFHIWRSGSAEGTYTQITDALIPAEGGPSMGAVYAYEDTNMLRKVYTRHDRNRNRIYVFQDLAGGRAYYYRLEAIDDAGMSEFFGPVSASVQNPAPAPKGWGKIVKP